MFSYLKNLELENLTVLFFSWKMTQKNQMIINSIIVADSFSVAQLIVATQTVCTETKTPSAWTIMLLSR